MKFEHVVDWGPSGLGDVRFNMSETGQLLSAKIVSEDGTVYPIAAEGVWDNVIRKSVKSYYWSLTSDETELTAVRPYQGMFPVKFAGFTRRGESDIPTPYIKRGGERTRRTKSGKIAKYNTVDENRFTSILEIYAGEAAGYSYIYWLPYVFELSEGNSAKARSKNLGYLDRLNNFMRRVGWPVDDESVNIPYSENVLPYLETRFLELAEANPFMATIENGWPVRLDPIPTGMVFEDSVQDVARRNIERLSSE